MHSKKFIKVFAVLTLALSIFSFSGCGLLDGGLDGLGDAITERVMDIVEGAFEEYREFGLVFDPETSTLYYNGEEVAFFEDTHGIGTTSYGNRNASGLHVSPVRDGSGNLIGLETTIMP